MTTRDNSTKSLWRRLVSCIAIYAFVLQSILVGMAAFSGVAAADGVAGFEICQHSLDGADTGTGTPAQHPLDAAHCKFCLSIAHAIAPAPRPLPRVTFDVILSLSTPTHDSDLPTPSELSTEQPRGPPYEA
jgi:hypothetical protein